MGSVPGGRHDLLSIEESSDRAGVYYIPDNIQCRRRLWRLMGSETVDLTSARYMDALADKVLQDYEEKLKERERELAQNEVRRERDLIIRGIIPDPDENKKRQTKKGSWGAMQRHREFKQRSKKELSSGRPSHQNRNMPDGLSNYQQKIFCSSNFRDFTDGFGCRGGTSSELPESRRTSRDGTKSKSPRK